MSESLVIIHANSNTDLFVGGGTRLRRISSNKQMHRGSTREDVMICVRFGDWMRLEGNDVPFVTRPGSIRRVEKKTSVDETGALIQHDAIARTKLGSVIGVHKPAPSRTRGHRRVTRLSGTRRSRKRREPFTRSYA